MSDAHLQITFTLKPVFYYRVPVSAAVIISIICYLLQLMIINDNILLII